MVKAITSIEINTIFGTKDLFVLEIIAKNTGVIVRAISDVPIFTTCKIFNGGSGDVFTEAFPKELKMARIKDSMLCASIKKFFVAISEGNKDVTFVHLSLIDAANSPLTGAFETAADATATRDVLALVEDALLDRYERDFSRFRIDAFFRRIEPDWGVAGHFFSPMKKAPRKETLRGAQFLSAIRVAP